MEKPKINNEAIRRRVLWNRSDLQVYAQPTSVENTTTLKKQKEREEIEQQTKLFTSRGGTIEVLPPETTGYESAQTFVINPRKGRDSH